MMNDCYYTYTYIFKELFFIMNLKRFMCFVKILSKHFWVIIIIKA